MSALEADAHDHAAAELAAVPRPVALRVWRKNFRAFHQEITPPQAHLLQMTLTGCAFAAWCETLAAGGEADPAARAAEWLVDALNEELLNG